MNHYFPEEETIIDIEIYPWMQDLETLPELPLSLEVLSCSGCYRLVSLPQLDHLQNLKRLEILYCSSLTFIPRLPQNLTALQCDQCFRLNVLPPLPENLIVLICPNCPELIALPEFPKTLLYLICHGIDNLLFLPKLPESLIELDCSACHNLVSLFPEEEKNKGELPLNLKKLNCMSCISLEFLPRLPNSLTILECVECSKLQFLPNIPKSLKTFQCDKQLLQMTIRVFGNLLNEGVDCLEIKEQIKNRAFKRRCQTFKISSSKILEKRLKNCEETRLPGVKQNLNVYLNSDTVKLVSVYSHDIDPAFKANFKRSRSQKKKSLKGSRKNGGNQKMQKSR